MRKCPDCAQENINESLFCKHCGRCLLAPDPEVIRLPAAAQAECLEIPEAIDVHDSALVNHPGVFRPKRKQKTEASIIMGWLLLLNFLVLILVTQIAMNAMK